MAETTSRILTLLTLLQAHRQWRGGELAERLGVTERTLRRDIERLRELGYRVEASRGVAGGYRLEAGSQLPPLLLSDEEAVTMAISLRLAAVQGLVDGELTTLSALAKFEQVLPAALRRRVNAIAAYVQPQSRHGGWGTGDGSARPSTAVSQDVLGQLALACRDRERLRFHYVAADGSESERSVEPHTLVSASGHWFLVCWDRRRDDWRTFRVDRLSGLSGTRVRFEPRALPADDAAQFVRDAVRSLRRRTTAWVRIALPLADLRERLGGWSAGAEEVDAASCRWPIEGEGVESMVAALAWIPEGVGYTIDGDPEFTRAVQANAERMLDAVAGNSPVRGGDG